MLMSDVITPPHFSAFLLLTPPHSSSLLLHTSPHSSSTLLLHTSPHSSSTLLHKNPDRSACISILAFRIYKCYIINVYPKYIIATWPRIQKSNTAKMHDFYYKILWNAQSLKTLDKLKEIAGYVRITIDKFEGIREDFVQTDDTWQEWKFNFKN
jgi:hypothetical protein